MRVFVAIELDPGVKKTVGDFVQNIRRTGAAVKWINPGGMHLTLKFLGEVDPGTLRSIEEEIRKAASLSSKFPLVLEGTGSFPSGRRPRVLWIGVRDEPALAALQASLEKGLGSLGFPPEERPFRPHLTVGRVKGPAGLAGAVEELEKSREVRFGEMAVEKLTLFQSILKPEGAVYRALAEFTLS
jgi:2'-5' RNA ligase